MSLISSLLPLDNVVINLECSSKKSAFEEIGRLFESRHKLSGKLVLDSLMAREALGSTGLGHGIAIPHGRIKGLKEALTALVRLTEPIPFDAPDNKPVQLLFVLLVPEHATDLHLQILGELAQKFGDKSLREQLMQVQDVARLHQIITQ